MVNHSRSDGNIFNELCVLRFSFHDGAAATADHHSVPVKWTRDGKRGKSSKSASSINEITRHSQSKIFKF